MKLHYISDLHFDYKKKTEITRFLKMLDPKKTYLMCGDFFNDIVKTLVLIKAMEKKHIKGYWLLGNHEFIYLFEPGKVDPEIKTELPDELFNKPSIEDCNNFLDFVKNETKNNKYFKMLYTGISYNLPNGWKLIGDTGWGTYKFNNGKKIDDFKKYEWNHVSNWDWTRDQNKKFVTFMNNFFKKNKKVIVATHHPLYFPEPSCLTKSRFASKTHDESLFWFSHNDISIPKDRKVIFVHGHTHTDSYKEQHVTNAIGRHENEKKLEFKALDL